MAWDAEDEVKVKVPCRSREPPNPSHGPLGSALSPGQEQVLALMSPVVHTARTESRFLWRLVSTTHMVSWPLRICDMASSSTSSVC